MDLITYINGSELEVLFCNQVICVNELKQHFPFLITAVNRKIRNHLILCSVDKKKLEDL